MTNAGYIGPYDLRSNATEYEQLAFVISQRMALMRTATLVKIVKAYNTGDVAPVGFVDVQPMVNQIDGQGRPTAHGTIYNLPYLRMQGGTNAVIIDPVAGDFGLAVFCHSDISSAKANKAIANPGSRRKYDWADGVYVGGLLNGPPTQYVQFTGANMNIVSTGTITIQAPTVAVTGNLTVSGTVVAQGDVTGNGTNLHAHKHSGVTVGTGNSGNPV